MSRKCYTVATLDELWYGHLQREYCSRLSGVRTRDLLRRQGRCPSCRQTKRSNDSVVASSPPRQRTTNTSHAHGSPKQPERGHHTPIDQHMQRHAAVTSSSSSSSFSSSELFASASDMASEASPEPLDKCTCMQELPQVLTAEELSLLRTQRAYHFFRHLVECELTFPESSLSDFEKFRAVERITGLRMHGWHDRPERKMHKSEPRIQISLSKSHYWPGEPISGLVTITARKDILIQRLSVQYLGLAFGSDAQRILFFEKSPLISVRSDHAGVLISKGDHFYRIKGFTLPSSLPPTYEGTNAWVNYWVRGYVKVTRGRQTYFNNVVRFQVKSYHPQMRSLTDVCTFSHTQHLRDRPLGRTSGRVKLHAALSHRCVYPGETVSLDVTVENQSSDKLDKIQYGIFRYESIRSLRDGPASGAILSTPFPKSSKTRKKVFSGTITDIATQNLSGSGSSPKVYSTTIEIPRFFSPSVMLMANYTPFLTCCYGVYVRVRYNVSVVIPIHVSSAPFPPPRSLTCMPLVDLLTNASSDALNAQQGLFGVLSDVNPVLPNTEEYHHHQPRTTSDSGSSSEQSGDEISAVLPECSTSADSVLDSADSPPAAAKSRKMTVLPAGLSSSAERKSTSKKSKRSFNPFHRGSSGSSKSGSRLSKKKAHGKSAHASKPGGSPANARWELEPDTKTRLANGL
eukprot:CAMPEP_0177631016 /NCGR_PEP_ID=MMETSP0447-20121125/1524_1 /TAXON_ID=0 /ORGANISM="Stygamoeba regulata, Strain BSH-02190019" /LENGTH=685 /DNA_ID=CAMNT_0019132471 /DNA_START=543 /DNA_END=2600 /DNA_ORIENTATION=-